MDRGTAVDIIYLEFGKAFNTVSHNTFSEKLMKYRLDEKTYTEPTLKTGWCDGLKGLWLVTQSIFKSQSSVVNPSRQQWVITVELSMATNWNTGNSKYA